MLPRSSFFTLLPILLALNAGCGASPTDATNGDVHEHVDGGETDSMEAAITKVASLRNSIRDGFANDDPDAAHGPLHEVGDVLLLIPELAKRKPVSAEDQATIEAEVNALMDAFGEVDKTLHGQEGSTYDEESAAIDAALESLAQACGMATGSAGASSAGSVNPLE